MARASGFRNWMMEKRQVGAGAPSRDLLIGGRGSDRLVGNAGDDLLIAGSTAFDANEAALAAVLREWTRTDLGYRDRINHLLGAAAGGSSGGANGSFNLNDQTVADDNAYDVLTGSAGQDWFFFNFQDGGVKDKVTDLKSSEFATDIDWINGIS